MARSNISRLRTIRAENRAARVVDGLGAVNIPFARQFGSASMSQFPTPDNAVASIQATSQARAALAVLDTQIRVRESAIQRLFGRIRALGRESAGASATASTRSTLTDRVQQKGFGPKAGRMRSPIRISAQGDVRLGRGVVALSKAAIVGQTVAGVANIAADAQDRLRERLKGVFTPQQLQNVVTQEAKRIGADMVVGAADTTASLIGLKSLLSAGLRFQGADKEMADNAVGAIAHGWRRGLDNIIGTGYMRDIREKAAKSFFAAISEGERVLAKQWNLVQNTLPTTFSVRARDLQLFKSQQQYANELRREDIRTHTFDEADRIFKARIRDGG